MAECPKCNDSLVFHNTNDVVVANNRIKVPARCLWCHHTWLDTYILAHPMIKEVGQPGVAELYARKKSQVTLDGRRAIIGRLEKKFPVVSTSPFGYEVEFSAATVERILNDTCAFKSEAT